MTTTPTIHGKRPVYSASAARAAIGDALSAIKAEDKLTWDDLGAVLGKSPDMAAKYADGSAVMDAVTFGRAKREWNGRFTGRFDRLCVESRPAVGSDFEHQRAVIRAVAALAEALADDGEISPAEVRQHRSELESARDALEELLRRGCGLTAVRS